MPLRRPGFIDTTVNPNVYPLRALAFEERVVLYNQEMDRDVSTLLRFL